MFVWRSRDIPPQETFVLCMTLVPGARFSKAPESFRARKAVFRSSVSKSGEVYTPETSCMKGTPLHL